jgi:hypothetical protein
MSIFQNNWQIEQEHTPDKPISIIGGLPNSARSDETLYQTDWTKLQSSTVEGLRTRQFCNNFREFIFNP